MPSAPVGSDKRGSQQCLARLLQKPFGHFLLASRAALTYLDKGQASPVLGVVLTSDH